MIVILLVRSREYARCSPYIIPKSLIPYSLLTTNKRLVDTTWQQVGFPYLALMPLFHGLHYMYYSLNSLKGVIYKGLL